MANPADLRLGPDFKVDIESQPFACIEYDATDDLDSPKCTDSESPVDDDGHPFESIKGGIRRTRITLTAQRDSTVSIGATPLFISPGAYVGLVLWPDGRSGDPVRVPEFFVQSVQSSGRVEGSPVQTIRVSGQSNLEYSRQEETLS